MMLNEHIAWNDHIHATEKKHAKYISLLYIYTGRDSYLIRNHLRLYTQAALL